jgi:anti-anti-sigma regulatory factor
MDVRIRWAEKALMLTLSGKLDAITAPDYEQQVAAALATAR